MKNKKREPLRILSKDRYEDDDYIYIIDHLSDGNVIKNLHPKYPEKSKDEIFKELNPMILNAWDEAQARKKARMVKAEG